jgi:hypothetical protein
MNAATAQRGPVKLCPELRLQRAAGGSWSVGIPASAR